MSQPEVKKFESVEALNRFAAEAFVMLSSEAIGERGRFTVALSGGSTPKKLYEMLASDEFRNRIEWDNVHIFWGDERCVPPNSPNSNYRMANEALLSKVPIPSGNIHRFFAELGDPKNIAKKMEMELRASFSLTGNAATNEERFPRFDLIFLGMGTDGHTASLFPGTSALNEQKRTVIENFVPTFDAYRLTLTFPTINNAREIIFLVAGSDKAVVLDEVLNGKYQPEKFPSQGVKPTNGNLLFLTAP